MIIVTNGQSQNLQLTVGPRTLAIQFDNHFTLLRQLLSASEECQARIRSLNVSLTQPEIKLKQRILKTLVGKGKPENMAQDAEHLFEAQKYGSYFITVDRGILRKADALWALCGLVVLRPSTFLALLQSNA